MELCHHLLPLHLLEKGANLLERLALLLLLMRSPLALLPLSGRKKLKAPMSLRALR